LTAGSPGGLKARPMLLHGVNFCGNSGTSADERAGISLPFFAPISFICRERITDYVTAKANREKYGE